MAYDSSDLMQRAAHEIESKKLFFVADVISCLGVVDSTFYAHFPVDSKELEYLKEKLNMNRANTKVSIRAKLHKSTAPAALLALYKLICTDEERKALSMQHVDHTSKGEKLPAPIWVDSKNE
jgi:hypothetical protein